MFFQKRFWVRRRIKEVTIVKTTRHSESEYNRILLANLCYKTLKYFLKNIEKKVIL